MEDLQTVVKNSISPSVMEKLGSNADQIFMMAYREEMSDRKITLDVITTDTSIAKEIARAVVERMKRLK